MNCLSVIKKKGSHFRTKACVRKYVIKVSVRFSSAQCGDTPMFHQRRLRIFEASTSQRHRLSCCYLADFSTMLEGETQTWSDLDARGACSDQRVLS